VITHSQFVHRVRKETVFALTPARNQLHSPLALVGTECQEATDKLVKTISGVASNGWSNFLSAPSAVALPSHNIRLIQLPIRSIHIQSIRDWVHHRTLSRKPCQPMVTMALYSSTARGVNLAGYHLFTTLSWLMRQVNFLNSASVSNR
jgi:hypothetical protein